MNPYGLILPNLQLMEAFGLNKALFLLLLWQLAQIARMPSQKCIVISAPSQSPAGQGPAQCQ